MNVRLTAQERLILTTHSLSCFLISGNAECHRVVTGPGRTERDGSVTLMARWIHVHRHGERDDFFPPRLPASTLERTTVKGHRIAGNKAGMQTMGAAGSQPS